MEEIIICNACGKEIKVVGGIPVEDYLHVEKEWGYFSEKDGDIHTWNLCENCYGEMTHSFAIPMSDREASELV